MGDNYLKHIFKKEYQPIIQEFVQNFFNFWKICKKSRTKKLKIQKNTSANKAENNFL